MHTTSIDSTLGYFRSYPHGQDGARSCAQDKWLGVSELIHPVARFYLPTQLTAVPAGDPRRLDPKGTVRTSWEADVFIDPDFRGAYFESLRSSYAAAAGGDDGGDRVGDDGVGPRVFEYHMMEVRAV